ncbi:hypothetical protein G3I77_34910 [Streptomyces sp. D2-8]|uniref:hypothetical protein n=1 Tax=Streptomyces sp. D2-8 TaxID=2707767 RepID=UPI0020C09F1E|nr:hypothetical protein [Streptomyces sp. D2-8]MCK8438016.1 hypothetical protein [Streptomyces sp. D2-8]
MSENLMLGGLAVALRSLRLLAVDFSHLPAPDVQVSPVFPDRLELGFHRGLPDFEVWREALGISPDAVVYREQGDGRTRVLKASADFAGSALELTGYSDACAPELIGGAA